MANKAVQEVTTGAVDAAPVRKNLANCKPSEFLRQANKIRKSAEKWLADTDVMNIVKRKGNPDIPANATAEEKKRIEYEAAREQAKINFSDALDAMLDEHPDETMEILALCCFIEPQDVDNYPMSMYIGAIADLINDKDVLDFFTSLMRVAQMNGLSA